MTQMEKSSIMQAIRLLLSHGQSATAADVAHFAFRNSGMKYMGDLTNFANDIKALFVQYGYEWK